MQCGDRLRAAVRLLTPEIYRDPGVWSRADYLLDQNITATATLPVAQVRTSRSLVATPPCLACRLHTLQQASGARLLALPAAMRRLPAPLRLTPDDAIMLAAMVTGDRTYLTHTLRAGFERTGSFHMLVVSGFHLAIVAGCIFWLARRLRLPRVPATLLTLARVLRLRPLHRLRHPRPAFPLDGHPLPPRTPTLSRPQPPQHHRIRRPLPARRQPPQPLRSSFQMTLLAVVAIAGIAAPLLQATIHPYLAATHQLRLIAIDTKLTHLWPSSASYSASSPRPSSAQPALRRLAHLSLPSSASPSAPLNS